MDQQLLFVFFHNQNLTSTGTFSLLPKSESLPFPLNTQWTGIALMTIYLSLNLTIGCLLRSKILRYCWLLSVRDNPINLFIWYDQLCGALSGLNIVYSLTALHLPVPLSSFIGEAACNWVDLIGATYLIGQVVWSNIIATYRLLFIKFHGLLVKGRRKNWVVLLLSVAGYIFICASAVLFAYYDKGILYRLCAHHSVEELKYMQVNLKKTVSRDLK